MTLFFKLNFTCLAILLRCESETVTRYPFNREHTQCPACLTKQRSVRKISNGRYTRTLDLYLPKNLNSCPRPLSRTENMRENSPKKQLCNNFVKLFVGNKVSSLHLCHAHELVKYQYKLSSFLEKWAWFWLRRQTSCLPFRSTRFSLRHEISFTSSSERKEKSLYGVVETSLVVLPWHTAMNTLKNQGKRARYAIRRDTRFAASRDRSWDSCVTLTCSFRVLCSSFKESLGNVSD